MKKFYAILLGTVLVLGLAGVASAAFTTSGQVELKLTDDLMPGVVNQYSWSASPRAEIKLSQSAGPVSGAAAIRLVPPDSSLALKIDKPVDIRTSSFSYKFADELTLGVMYARDQAYYTAPVTGDWKLGPDRLVWLKGSTKLGDFTADLYNNGEFEDTLAGGLMLWMGNASYKIDDLTLGGSLYQFAEGPGVGNILGLKASYAMDALTLEGEYDHVQAIGAVAEDSKLGAKATYKLSDDLALSAAVLYGIESEEIEKYELKGIYKKLTVTYAAYPYDLFTFKPIGKAFTAVPVKNDGETLTGEYALDANTTLKVEWKNYWDTTEKETLTGGVTIKF